MTDGPQSTRTRSAGSAGSASPGGPRRPTVIVLDVNETLSDMSPMAERFSAVGAPGHLAQVWFAGVLRDGFSLTAVGVNAPFATIATAGLRVVLTGRALDRSVDDAVAYVMDGFAELSVHADVPAGIEALAHAGHRLVTLSDGSTSVAESLLQRAGVGEHVEALLSVEDAPLWKPAAAAYAHALERCEVDASDAMLVAVHPWDIDGASRAGLATAWVARDGAPYPDHFERPDLTVGSLTALARELAG